MRFQNSDENVDICGAVPKIGRTWGEKWQIRRTKNPGSGGQMELHLSVIFGGPPVPYRLQPARVRHDAPRIAQAHPKLEAAVPPISPLRLMPLHFPPLRRSMFDAGMTACLGALPNTRL